VTGGGRDLALPDPQTLAVMEAQALCARLETWADGVHDLAVLDRARAWANAMEAFLGPKQAEGPAQRAARILESRIGQLLGRAVQGRPGKGRKVTRELPFPKPRASEFRLLFEHRKVWFSLLPLSRARALRLIRNKQAAQREAPSRPEGAPTCDLRKGDFRKVLADIPDASVDIVLTDPPYPAEFLPLWSDLAVFSKRVLKPDGLLVAMSGQTHLPEVFRRLGEYLTYRWTIAYLATGQATTVHGRRVHSMWKPVLVYGNRTRRLYDVARSGAVEKHYHDWGQSESGMSELLRLVADPGQLICDPFLGGGTTAIVAREYGCPFIGAEVEKDAYETARRRLAA